MSWLLVLACAADADEAPFTLYEPASATRGEGIPAPVDPIAAWMEAPIPVADGFSLPVRSKAGCGEGCWAGAGTVSAIAAGIVREVEGDTLVTEHLWYDDEVKHTARFTWRGVASALSVGDRITRGQPVGTAAQLTLAAPPELGPVETFLAARPRLPTPQAEPVVAVVAHDTHQLRIYTNGRPQGTYEISLGQAEGDKEVRGDNRTPKGVYFVVAQSTGPFDGAYGAYYGGHWTKLSYPNAWDAARGVDAGLFGVKTQRAITAAYWARREPPQGTKLGGGIGIHGWAEEWADDGPRGLSWGCVVAHLRDVEAIYAALPVGSMVALI